MSDLPFFPENSDDLLRSHLARLNIDSENINSAADRTELINLAQTKGNKLMANGGSYGDHTIDAATYSGVAERQAWVTGNGVNLTLSPVAYGQNSADQYTNFVLDLTGGGSVKIYGLRMAKTGAGTRLGLAVTLFARMEDFWKPIAIFKRRNSGLSV